MMIFTLHEVNKFILSMKNNKATGYDGIPAEAWMMKGSRGVSWAIPGSSLYRDATLERPRPSVHGEEPHPKRGDPFTQNTVHLKE
jgi:hypothetical protein